MTIFNAASGAVLAAGSSSSTKTNTGSSDVFLLFIVAIGLVGYFVFLRPRAQQAKRQRQDGANIAVGDEIVTVGGIVGTVLDITGDRVSIVTGSANDEGMVGGPPPTRLEMVRQAIARKLPPVSSGTGIEEDDDDPVDPDGADDADHHDQHDEHDQHEEHEEHDDSLEGDGGHGIEDDGVADQPSEEGSGQ